jgi:hypothetical protein
MLISMVLHTDRFLLVCCLMLAPAGDNTLFVSYSAWESYEALGKVAHKGQCLFPQTPFFPMYKTAMPHMLMSNMLIHFCLSTVPCLVVAGDNTLFVSYSAWDSYEALGKVALNGAVPCLTPFLQFIQQQCFRQWHLLVRTELSLTVCLLSHVLACRRQHAVCVVQRVGVV